MEIMMSIPVTARGALARDYFEQGYNCAQAVAAAFADLTDIPLPTLLRLASPFGGGMGRLREVCGAVSGMTMVLSCVFASTDPNDQKKKKALYALIQQAAGDFKAENGSYICRELLNLDEKVSNPEPEKRTEQYYKKRPCAELVKCAAEITEKYLNLSK